MTIIRLMPGESLSMPLIINRFFFKGLKSASSPSSPIDRAINRQQGDIMPLLFFKGLYGAPVRASMNGRSFYDGLVSSGGIIKGVSLRVPLHQIY